MFFMIIYFTRAQEVSTLLLAAWVMGDRMSLLNWLGFAVCLCGISLHVSLKALKSRREFGFCKRSRAARRRWCGCHDFQEQLAL